MTASLTGMTNSHSTIIPPHIQLALICIAWTIVYTYQSWIRKIWPAFKQVISRSTNIKNNCGGNEGTNLWLQAFYHEAQCLELLVWPNVNGWLIFWEKWRLAWQSSIFQRLSCHGRHFLSSFFSKGNEPSLYLAFLPAAKLKFSHNTWKGFSRLGQIKPVKLVNCIMNKLSESDEVDSHWMQVWGSLDTTFEWAKYK